MGKIIGEKRKFNKSTPYLVPMLFGEVEIDKSNLENSYLFYGDYMTSEPLLYLLFKYNDSFAKYEKEYIQSKLYVDQYDPDEGHVVVCFKIPDKHNVDYYNFLEGNYSKFTKKLKDKIKKFWALNNNSRVYQVLYKSDDLRQQMGKQLGCTIPASNELSSKPETKLETFKI